MSKGKKENGKGRKRWKGKQGKTLAGKGGKERKDGRIWKEKDEGKVGWR